MAYSDNVLKAVATLADADIGMLQNTCALIKYSNKKFQDFTSRVANYGDTINIQKPFRMNAFPGIPATFSSASVTVRWQPLTLNKTYNAPWIVSSEQLVEYPFDDYKNGIGKAGMLSMGAKVETDLSQVIVDHTFRSWANVTRTSGRAVVTAPSSYTDLASVYQRMVSFGIPDMANARMFISNDCQPSIVATGLSQFAPRRADRDYMSYDVGNFNNMDFHTSNMLVPHTAGTIGNANIPTTVTAISGDGATLTIHTGNNASLKSGDIITIADVANVFQFLKFTGYTNSQEYVQVRVTADVTANGSGVASVPIYPALIYDATGVNTERNINLDITAAIAGGDVFNVYCLPDHRAGLFVTGNAFYFASPRLGDLHPFPTSIKTDAKSGLSVRSSYGSFLDSKQTGYSTDILTGATLFDEYAIRVAFPGTTQNGGFGF